MASQEIKETNIEVCVRIRPLLVDNSSESRFQSFNGSKQRVRPKSRLGTPKTAGTPLGASPAVDPIDGASSPAPSEIAGETFMAWDVVGNDAIQQSSKTDIIQGRTISYTLDQVYGPLSTTQELYEKSVQPVVLSSMEGYHASVFAYGQTSTGKTYTMTGSQNNPGIVPLAVYDIFDYIQKGDEAAREYLMRVSYLEIYNEQVIDLLTPDNHRHTSAIRIMEGKEGVVVRGLREEVVTTPEAIFALLKKGEHRRQVGSTNMNKHSSRSHAIVRIWLESKSEGKNGKTISSSLSLVDLAGSESVRLTGSTGERKREGQYINKSLMSLGQVIYKLSEQQKSHIPYRDSKLTRLLQPSLSGNAQVVCVCNISPSEFHIEESHNTLKFATRAKKIQQRVVLNEVQDQNTLLQEYKDEIEVLKQQLAEARAESQQQQNDEDARELVLAIQKMEALILTTHNFQREHDDLLSPDSDQLLLSPEFRTPIGPHNNLTVDTSHTMGGMEKSPLLDEMERIQELLEGVLTKQGRTTNLMRSGKAISETDMAAFAKREEEVEELRYQLQEMEVATSLKRADTSFLQSQLQQKDMLLAEVAQILEVVEQRQIELETDNNLLTKMVVEKDRKLALKDRRIADKERQIVELRGKLRKT